MKNKFNFKYFEKGDKFSLPAVPVSGNNFPGIASQFDICILYVTAIQDMFCVAVFLQPQLGHNLFHHIYMHVFINEATHLEPHGVPLQSHASKAATVSNEGMLIYLYQNCRHETLFLWHASLKLKFGHDLFYNASLIFGYHSIGH